MFQASGPLAGDGLLAPGCWDGQAPVPWPSTPEEVSSKAQGSQTQCLVSRSSRWGPIGSSWPLDPGPLSDRHDWGHRITWQEVKLPDGRTWTSQCPELPLL